MQILTRGSKILSLILLSCSLLLPWEWVSVNYSPLKQVYSGSIWDSIISNFQLDHQADSAPVQAEIRKLLADPNDFNRILQASAPYLYYIFNQTKARNLPGEITLIPVIESEFNPNDHSKKGALGLWQLMAKTAHDLGVTVKGGYDGRRNVVASTNAALAYFNDLGNLFKGNWYLAIAAYNCGQGKVQSVVRRTGSDNFWNLPLPKETKLYVPRLLAVAAIIKNPQKYGVQLPQISNQPYFTEKQVDSVNLNEAAKSLNVSVKTLSVLNPDLTKGAPKKAPVNTVLIPLKRSEAEDPAENKTKMT